jgi:hypothetical protein
MVYQVKTRTDGNERKFLYVSGSHERLTGVPSAAVLADPAIPYLLVHPDDRPALAEAEARALRDRRPFDVQVRSSAPTASCAGAASFRPRASRRTER